VPWRVASERLLAVLCARGSCVCLARCGNGAAAVHYRRIDLIETLREPFRSRSRAHGSAHGGRHRRHRRAAPPAARPGSRSQFARAPAASRICATVDSRLYVGHGNFIFSCFLGAVHTLLPDSNGANVSPPPVPVAWRFLACARSALGTTRMLRGHAGTAGTSSSGESLLASSLAAVRSEADGDGSGREEAASAAHAPCPGWFWYNRFCRSNLTRNSSLDSSCARFSARCSIFLICAVICGKLIFESDVMASASSASSSCLSAAASLTKREGTMCLCQRGMSRCVHAQRQPGTWRGPHTCRFCPETLSDSLRSWRFASPPARPSPSSRVSLAKSRSSSIVPAR
jgi:hypothetical protein